MDKGVTFTQTRSLTSGPASCPGPYSRERTGTRESWDCGYGSWAPARNTWLVTENKEQRRTASLDDPVNCPDLTRIIQGTGPTSWTPNPNTVCSGQSFEQSRLVYSIGSPGNTTGETRDATGTKICVCRYGGWHPSASNYTVGTQFDQFRDPLPGEPAHCKRESRDGWGTQPTDWTPDTDDYCEGVILNQTRLVYSTTSPTRTEVQTRQATGTKICKCQYGPWYPDPDDYVVGTQFTQYSDPLPGQPIPCARKSRPAWGTDPTNWLPYPSTVCAGESFTQTRWVYSSTAPNRMQPQERNATGTKNCPPPPPPCDYNDWAPASCTIPSGQSFLQSRTEKNSQSHCPTQNRTATGTATRIEIWQFQRRSESTPVHGSYCEQLDGDPRQRPSNPFGQRCSPPSSAIGGTPTNCRRASCVLTQVNYQYCQ